MGRMRPPGPSRPSPRRGDSITSARPRVARIVASRTGSPHQHGRGARRREPGPPDGGHLPRQPGRAAPRGGLHPHRLVQALVLLHVPRHRPGAAGHRVRRHLRRALQAAPRDGHASASSRMCSIFGAISIVDRLPRDLADPDQHVSIWDYGTAGVVQEPRRSSRSSASRSSRRSSRSGSSSRPSSAARRTASAASTSPTSSAPASVASPRSR